VNMVVLNRLCTLSLSRFSSKEKADDISGFFKDKIIKGFDRGLQQVLFCATLEVDVFRVSIWLMDMPNGWMLMRRFLRIGLPQGVTCSSS
jgi:hypothetical protein